MIDLVILLGILVWPFGQLLQLPTGWGIGVTLLDLLAFTLMGFLVLDKRLSRQIKEDRLLRPILAFDVVSLISLVVGVWLFKANALLSFAYWFRFVAYQAIYFGFRVSKIYWRKWLILASIVFLSFGFIQYLFLPDLRFLYYLGFDDHLYRWVGTMLDPNYAGLILVLLTLWSLVQLGGKKKILSLIPLLALVLTFSRASFLTLGFCLLYLIVRQKNYLLMSVAVLFALFLYLVPKPFGEGVNLARTFSIQSRLHNQEVAITMFVQKPLFGQGFGVLKSQQGVSRQYGIPVRIGGVDNSFLFVLVSAGIVGFVVFLYLLTNSWMIVWPNPLLSALVLSIWFHSLFNNSFFYNWVLAVFWLILALANGTYKSDMSIKHISKGKAKKHGVEE